MQLKNFQLKSLRLFGASCLLCLLLKVGSISPVAAVKTTDISTPVVSLTSANGRFEQVVETWKQQLAATTNEWERAKIYERLGAAYYQTDRLGTAIEWWEKAAAIYHHSKDLKAKQSLAQITLDQAQAYLALGQYERAKERARWTLWTKLNLPRQVIAIAWGTLANAQAKSGEIDAALASYDKSYALARQGNNTDYVTTIVNNQVGVMLDRAAQREDRARKAESEGDEDVADALLLQADRDRAEASVKAAKAIEIAQNSKNPATVEALMNMMRVGSNTLTASYIEKAKKILDDLPDSRSTVYAWAKLAQFETPERQIKSLERAIAVAKNLGDRRAESLVLGKLGNLYERLKNFERAINLTRQAEFAAQTASALDSLYRWQWQAGRLYAATGNEQEAIAAYSQAIGTLSQVRSDLIAADRDQQFSFQDEVEPVYRQLLALLLQQKNSSSFQKVLQVADLLKIGELQNFFGDECLELIADNRSLAPKTAQKAVTINFLLADRLYAILQFPDGQLKKYAIETTVPQLRSKVERLRSLLEKVATEEYLPVARELYDLLVRPLERDINAVDPDRLVFVNDGILRTIPMSALHDGRQFLVEKYAVSYSLGLRDVRGERLLHERGALIFGLSQGVPPLDPLPSVVPETQLLQQMIGGKKFLNQDFVADTLANQVARNQKRSIVHLATHGEFSSAARTSFIQAFDRRIYLPQLEAILTQARQPLQLLTLSACQTAAGDNRAVLGLAGLAARVGVKNVVASLWFVDDIKIVPVMEDFYSYLKTDLSVEEALHQAQLKSIRSKDHPAVWSALIVVKS